MPGEADDPRTRSSSLDGLRAIAAFAVLAGHSYLLSGTFLSERDTRPLAVLVNSGEAGLWLFFAISGYLIAGPFLRALVDGAQSPSLHSYSLRRVTRIYPAYWVAFAVALLIGPGLSIGAGRLLLHAALLHNLVPGEQQAVFFVSWTLSVEVLFYAFVPVAFHLSRRRWSGAVSPNRLGTAIVGLWIASILWVAVVDAFAAPASPTTVYLRLVLPALLSMFCPGMLVYLAETEAAQTLGGPWARYRAAMRRPWAVLLLSGTFVGVGMAMRVSTNNVVFDLHRQSFAIACGLLVALALQRGARITKVFARLAPVGLVSYGIYLWQGVVLEILLPRAGHPPRYTPLPHEGGTAFLVHVTYVASASVILAVMSWFVVERPVLHWARRRSPRRDVEPGRAAPTL
jgi:peptidoglycan/LPS O-acetylase OafA/YrhL